MRLKEMLRAERRRGDGESPVPGPAEMGEYLRRDPAIPKGFQEQGKQEF